MYHTEQWKDIWITVPNRVDFQTFKRSIGTFFVTLHLFKDPTYEDEYIYIQPRKPIQQDEGLVEV
jgi:hypothetical protein